MKARELEDACIESSYEGASIVVELDNGARITTTGYTYGTDKRGEPVLIIKVGRKLNTYT